MPTPGPSTSDPAPRCATCGFSLAGLPPGNCPQCDTPFAAGEKIAWEIGTTATDDSAWHCLKCNYKLTGLTHKHCPECGTPVDWYQMRLVADRSLRQATDGSLWRVTRGMKLRMMMQPLMIAIYRYVNSLLDRPGNNGPTANAVSQVGGYICLGAALILFIYSATEVSGVLTRQFTRMRPHEPRSFRFWLAACIFSPLTMIAMILANVLFIAIIERLAEILLHR